MIAISWVVSAVISVAPHVGWGNKTVGSSESNDEVNDRDVTAASVTAADNGHAYVHQNWNSPSEYLEGNGTVS